MKSTLRQRLAGWIAGKSASVSDFLTGRDVDGGSASAARLSLPYAQSAWIQAAIDFKTSEIASTELRFYDGETEYDLPAFADWWAKPFAGPGGRRLNQAEGRAQLAAWLDIAGECFVVLRDDWLAVGAARRGLQLSPPVIARPDRMRHVVLAGELVGWVLTDAAGRQLPFLPEQVFHTKRFNPYDDWRGLSPLVAVFNAAEGDYLAGVYTRNLMRNNGDQGVYIGVKGQPPTDPQREQILSQLREKRRRAQRGEFSAAFVPADIIVEDAKASAPDAAIQATRLASREEIFVGLRVPPSMSQVKATYSIGAASDRYQLITGACMSQARAIDDPLAQIASLQTGRTLTAQANWDDHPVMVEVRTGRVETALKLWGAGMPMQAANEFLGLGMKPYAGWDVGYLPFSVVPVEAAGAADPARDPALDEPADPSPDDPAVSQLRLLLLARQRAARPAPVCQSIDPARDAFALFACTCHDAGEGFVMKDRDPAEVAHWRTLMDQRRETLRGYQSRFGRELMKARAEVLSKIERGYKPVDKSAPATVTRAVAADFLFDLSKWREGFQAAMRRQAATSLDTAGRQLFEEIGRDDPFKFPSEAALHFVNERENRLSGIPDEVHGRIKEALEEGITAGDSTEELSKRVRAVCNAIDQGRGRTLATTETAAVYGQARDVAMKQAGVAYKGWLTSGAANVRAAHAAANGQVVPIDEPFEVGGEQLDHPGDPAGSPENVINCHCVQIAKAKPNDPDKSG